MGKVSLLLVHAQHLDQKGPDVGGLLDQDGRRFAHPVPGLGLDADEDGRIACLGLLQGS